MITQTKQLFLIATHTQKPYALNMKNLAYLSLSLLLSSCALSISTPKSITTNSINVTISKEDCKQNGWQNLKTKEVQSFKNQGECVSYYNK